MFLQSQINLSSKECLTTINKALGIQTLRDGLTKYKERKIVKLLEKDDFRKRMEFFKAVLHALPFLYSKSEEMEEYQWVKLSYNLHLKGLLIPELVRYQVGPTFYVSFGSIATQLKREFYLMLLDNEMEVYNLTNSRKVSIMNLRYCRSFLNPVVTDHDKNYKYFTPQEMRHIILSGERLESDYGASEIIEDESCLDWYNKWGWVYETEPTCYRAVDMRIGNYRLELEALDRLLELGLQDAMLPNTTLKLLTVADLIKYKKSIILESYMPVLKLEQDKLLEKLHNCKKYSERYFKLLNY